MPSTEQKFYVDASGKYLGSWTGFKYEDELALDRDGAVILIDGEPVVLKVGAEILPNPPPGAIEVSVAPNDGRDTWDGKQWAAASPVSKPLSADELAQLLLDKGMISSSDLIAVSQETKL